MTCPNLLSLVRSLRKGWLGVAVWFALVMALGAGQPPERVPLWDGDAPVGDGSFTNERAFLTVFHSATSNSTAVVICPGGGYGGLVTGGEGRGIAEWLNQHGITGIVLEYRLPHGRPWVPLLDAQRAVRLARAKSVSWGIDPKRVGIMGFSAGGHLAATAATHFDAGDSSSPDAVAHEGCRPDFAILLYPVISMSTPGHVGSRENLMGTNPAPSVVAYFSCESQVGRETPPVFVAHAQDDHVVSIEQSRMFHRALDSKGIHSQLLELPSGDHGLNGYHGPMWDAWQEASLKWLVDESLLSRDRSALERHP